MSITSRNNASRSTGNGPAPGPNYPLSICQGHRFADLSHDQLTRGRDLAWPYGRAMLRPVHRLPLRHEATYREWPAIA